MATRATPPLLKQLNERTVLEAIRTGAPISRAEISRRAGISKPTVSVALQSLVDAGLVREAEPDPGRPSYGAVFFEPVADAALVLGLDVGARFLRGALCDLRGTVRARQDVELRDPEADDVVDATRGCAMRSSPRPTSRTRGSTASSSASRASSTATPTPSSDALREPRGAPARRRPARAARAARHARERHQPRGARGAVAGARARGGQLRVPLDRHGLGAGLVLRGELHRGRNGAAGEVDFALAPLGTSSTRARARSRRSPSGSRRATGDARRSRRPSSRAGSSLLPVPATSSRARSSRRRRGGSRCTSSRSPPSRTSSSSCSAAASARTATCCSSRCGAARGLAPVPAARRGLEPRRRGRALGRARGRPPLGARQRVRAARAARGRVSPRVLTVGETMALLDPVEDGPLELGRTLTLRIAGAESNFAVALARLGVDVAWVSRVGDDRFGELVREALGAGGRRPALGAHGARCADGCVLQVARRRPLAQRVLPPRFGGEHDDACGPAGRGARRRRARAPDRDHDSARRGAARARRRLARRARSGERSSRSTRTSGRRSGARPPRRPPPRPRSCRTSTGTCAASTRGARSSASTTSRPRLRRPARARPTCARASAPGRSSTRSAPATRSRRASRSACSRAATARTASAWGTSSRPGALRGTGDWETLPRREELAL